MQLNVIQSCLIFQFSAYTYWVRKSGMNIKFSSGNKTLDFRSNSVWGYVKSFEAKREHMYSIRRRCHQFISLRPRIILINAFQMYFQGYEFSKVWSICRDCYSKFNYTNQFAVDRQLKRGNKFVRQLRIKLP